MCIGIGREKVAVENRLCDFFSEEKDRLLRAIGREEKKRNRGKGKKKAKPKGNEMRNMCMAACCSV